MRLSLSVPDALWLRARDVYPLSGPSELVQTALESMLSRCRPPYAEGPSPPAAQRLQRLRQRLDAEARATYQAGCEAGLSLAEGLDWWAVDQLAAADWHLDRLLGSPRAAGVLDEVCRVLTEAAPEAARDLVAEIERGQRGDIRRAATFTSGLLAALRDCAEPAGPIAEDEAERARP